MPRRSGRLAASATAQASIPRDRCGPSRDRPSLPLNGFRGPETRMKTSFLGLRHRALPSLLPSKTERFYWRGRWTGFDGRLLQRINRQVSPAIQSARSAAGFPMKTAAKRRYTGSCSRRVFYRLDAARSNTMRFTSGGRQIAPLPARADARQSKKEGAGGVAVTLATHDNTRVVIVQNVVVDCL